MGIFKEFVNFKNVFKVIEFLLVFVFLIKKKLLSRCDIFFMLNFVFRIYCKDVEKDLNN